MPDYMDSLDDATLQARLQDFKQMADKGGILILLAEADKDWVERIQTIAEISAVPMVGAIFPEVIADHRFHKNGMVIEYLPVMLEHVIIQQEAGNSAQWMAAKIADYAKNCGVGHETLFMIFDSMLPNIASTLEHLYLHLGDRINYAGVNAGSETFTAMPCLFDHSGTYQNAVLTLYFNSNTKSFLEHGFTQPESIIAATSSEGNKISSIDWCPALDVYAEMAEQQYQVDINKENFYQYASHYPLGIIRMDGSITVRIPVAFEEDGSIYCVGEVPQNAMLTLLKANYPDFEYTARRLAEQLDPLETDNILSFYCAGRRMQLEDKAQLELDTLNNLLPAKILYGALSLGEIGSLTPGGYPLFHNATLVTIALFDK
ncbi:MAG: FIST C-terminal domain-containing protein [Gammaproteobacteria bacterium]|nr:FIST C-terminal domain-containing protein [Gammaproteobacteria bacterium]